MPVILIGFMGAGKSSTAKLLDENFADMDEILVTRLGQSISDFVKQFGEAEFRQKEEELLAELLNSGTVRVVAAGGGLVGSAACQEMLTAQSMVVYLRADFFTLLQRIENDTANQRFIYENSDLTDFEQIYRKRLPIYERLADLTLDNTNLTPAEAAELISEKFSI
jgi:shikimate kinase